MRRTHAVGKKLRGDASDIRTAPNSRTSSVSDTKGLSGQLERRPIIGTFSIHQAHAFLTDSLRGIDQVMARPSLAGGGNSGAGIQARRAPQSGRFGAGETQSANAAADGRKTLLQAPWVRAAEQEDHRGETLDLDSGFAAGLESHRGAGRPLFPAERLDPERAFEKDFSTVRVHTDAAAHALTSQFQARAITVGRHIYFGRGEYENTPEGDRVLQHELAHVARPSSGSKIGFWRPERLRTLREERARTFKRIMRIRFRMVFKEILSAFTTADLDKISQSEHSRLYSFMTRPPAPPKRIWQLRTWLTKHPCPIANSKRLSASQRILIAAAMLKKAKVKAEMCGDWVSAVRGYAEIGGYQYRPASLVQKKRKGRPIRHIEFFWKRDNRMSNYRGKRVFERRKAAFKDIDKGDWLEFDWGSKNHSVIFIDWDDTNKNSPVRSAKTVSAGIKGGKTLPAWYTTYRLSVRLRDRHKNNPHYVYAIMKKDLSRQGKRWLRGRGLRIP